MDINQDGKITLQDMESKITTNLNIFILKFCVKNIFAEEISSIINDLKIKIKSFIIYKILLLFILIFKLKYKNNYYFY